jgi:hypothetical protein
MSKTSIALPSLVVTGDGLSPLNDVGPTFTNTSAAAPTSADFTAATFKAVTVPSGSRYVKVNPPPGYAGSITLKGASGDTGTPIDPQNSTMLALPSSTPTLGFTLSVNATMQFTWG